MEKMRRYNIEGLILDIPLYYDEQADMYIENYPDFIGNPIRTPNGHRVLFSGTDACPFGSDENDGDCLDCGACKYFKKAAERSWIGICTNEHK